MGPILADSNTPRSVVPKTLARPGGRAKNVFIGLGVGALFKFVFGWLKVVPGMVKFAIPVLPKAQIGIKMSSRYSAWDTSSARRSEP